MEGGGGSCWDGVVDRTRRTRGTVNGESTTAATSANAASSSLNRRFCRARRKRCGCSSKRLLSPFPMVCAAVVAALSFPVAVFGWWDGGHMLVGAIAKLLLSEHEVEKLEAVLAMWEPEYPGLSSLATAPVWADHIKCTESGASYCRGLQRLDSIELFDQWHWIELLFNPQRLKLSVTQRAAPFPATGAVWAIQSAFSSLTHRIPPRGSLARRRRFTPEGESTSSSPLSSKEGAAAAHPPRRAKEGSPSSSDEEALLDDMREDVVLRGESNDRIEEGLENSSSESGDGLEEEEELPPRLKAVASRSGDVHGSKMSLNLELRLLLHIMGDLHQPLHAIECVSKLFPEGDGGGGKVHVHVEDGKLKKKVKSLHQLWDSIAGTYTHSWPFLTEAEVLEKARELMKRYSKDTLFEDGEDEGKLNLMKVARESHRIAIREVYSEFDWKTLDEKSDFLPYHPSAKYLTRAAVVAERQIVRGGHRLARVLRWVAALLPPLPAKGVVVGAAAVPPASSSSSLSSKSAIPQPLWRDDDSSSHKSRGGDEEGGGDPSSPSAPVGGGGASSTARDSSLLLAALQGPLDVVVWLAGYAAVVWFVTGAVAGFCLCLLLRRSLKLQAVVGGGRAELRAPPMSPHHHYYALK